MVYKRLLLAFIVWITETWKVCNSDLPSVWTWCWFQAWGSHCNSDLPSVWSWCWFQAWGSHQVHVTICLYQLNEEPLLCGLLGCDYCLPNDSIIQSLGKGVQVLSHTTDKIWLETSYFILHKIKNEQRLSGRNSFDSVLMNIFYE